MKEYITKDSGKREEYASGMVRDTVEGKPRYDLIPVPMLTRLAGLYARGAEKYGDNNWQLANSEEELQRFKASGLRHLYQWLDGQEDEDHATAAIWNIIAYETIKDKLADDSYRSIPSIEFMPRETEEKDRPLYGPFADGKYVAYDGDRL